MKSLVKKIIERNQSLLAIVTKIDLWKNNWVNGDEFNCSELEPCKIVQAIKCDGYYVLGKLYTDFQCERLRNEIDRVIDEYKEYCQVDEVGADHRVFGVENVSTLCREFTHNSDLAQICNGYLNKKGAVLATLAARMMSKEGNLGSGQGWHRDSFNPQFKAIVYLSDVTKSNGPFQYITGSHGAHKCIDDLSVAKLKLRQTRINCTQVDRLITEQPGRLSTLIAPQGTVVLADTRGIHRGMPIQRGVRYALTNYYYPERNITEQLVKHFPLIPRKNR